MALLLLLLFAAEPAALFSQNLHTTSNRALRAYRDGMRAYEYYIFDRAEILLKEAIKIDPGFYEAHLVLGEMMTDLKRYSEAATYYRKAVSIDSLFFRPVFFSLANAEMMSGDYERALIHYKVYVDQKDISEKNRIRALRNIRNCEFAIEAIKNPVPFDPEGIGPGINTVDDEYWPSITADGQTLMFTRQARQRDKSFFGKPSHEDFYLSRLRDGVWQKAVNAGAPLNTQSNEGAQSLSSDGTYMYFTACERSGGLGSCDIYFSFSRNGTWSEPVNVGSPVNTQYWESQPSVSADGKMLFFSSSRPGGMGGKDLWYSVMNKSGRWTNPKNLGDKVNTDGDEMSPFIHFDGRSLYFSSDGRPGMGGFDIYLTRMNEDSTWTEPVNLGYPINTYNDETGLVIESGGERAYFSSVRDNTYGKDIFSFKLHNSVRPDPVLYLRGSVIDRETGRLLMADYELTNLTTGSLLISNKTGAGGDFLVCLPSGHNYALNVSRPGYLFYSESFLFEGVHSLVEPFIKQIPLSPLKPGERMLLANVFFEVDSWELKSESLIELNRLADLLTENNNLVVEIGGYTDSTGTDEHNLVLSERRALSVVSYLKTRGITPERLKHKGYGNTSPVGDNITSEGRKINRRTEVKILSN